MSRTVAAAVPALKGALSRLQAGTASSGEDPPYMNAGAEVLACYQPIFAVEHLDALPAEELRGFLLFRNNRHWKGLQRLGSVAADVDRLRQALGILLDERQPIREWLNGLVPVTVR